MTNADRFQVELGGLIELLSEHLYSGPGVFVRELLQNGIDAIAARQRTDPTLVGMMDFEVLESTPRDSDTKQITIVFRDNGIGLTLEEMHTFLATIGQSSKRAGNFAAPTDFLGKFGIGLLSCFLVSDEIVVVSKSAREATAAPVEWRGRSDGTYEVRLLRDTIAVGTTVYLRCRTDIDQELVSWRNVRNLAKHYGEYLDVAIEMLDGDERERLNETAPWTIGSVVEEERVQLIEHAKTRFERDFQDVIPLHFERAGISGHAFVLRHAVHSASGQPHLVYLRGMLLAEHVKLLLPEWAFFVQCIVNTTELRPTASREALYENDLLDDTREALGSALRGYLVELSQTDASRFRAFIETHHVAVKALALEDDDCLRIFADWLPFETSLGTMTLGEFRRENPAIRYVTTRDQFRQIAPIAASESISVVNAGYIYDVEILERLRVHDTELEIEPFDMRLLANRFESLSTDEERQLAGFIRLANDALDSFGCHVKLSRFSPVDLPAVFVTDTNENFVRSIEDSAESSDELWADVLGGLRESVDCETACLHLNVSNPVVQKVSTLDNQTGVCRCVELLYLHAILLGHFPLRAKEVTLMNTGLIGVIDWAISQRGADHER